MQELYEHFLDDSKEQIVEFCMICNDKKEKYSRIRPCGHDFCDDCLKMYLEYKIINGEVLKVLCPYSDCGVLLEDSFIKMHVPGTYYFRYKTYKKLRLLEKNINLRWCSKPGCEGYSIGSIKNKKLTCNRCEGQFCYFCGNDWHEGQKCRNKLDKEFEKWVASNNVKFCPNCKHRALREGGCTEMKCPFCQHAWCWNCGVSTKEHNDYHCMMGKSFYELYWTTIFLFIFSPVLLPFAVFLSVVVKNEIFHINYRNDKTWARMLMYCGLFVASPLLLIIGVFGYCMMICSQLILECTGRRVYAIAVILGIFGGMLIGLAAFVGIGILCILLPPIGVVFFFIKLVFVLKRRCKYEKKWEYYPRTVI